MNKLGSVIVSGKGSKKKKYYFECLAADSKLSEVPAAYWMLVYRYNSKKVDSSKV